MSLGDGIIVTENEPRASRPDTTSDQAAAETRATQVVKDLNTGGLISRRTAVEVRDMADKAVKGADACRGFGKM
jgi:hypothetical protein